MPPKAKVTKEQIIAAAMEIAKESGIEAVTARELGNRMGVSSRPLYSVYASLEELKREVVKRVFRHYIGEMEKDNGITDPFLRGGLNYIHYARNFREFYRINNVTGHKYHDKEVGEMFREMVEKVRSQASYSEFTHEEMTGLFMKMWVFTHGLADLCSQENRSEFSDELILKLMKEVGEAVVRFELMIKKGEVTRCGSAEEASSQKKKR